MDGLLLFLLGVVMLLLSRFSYCYKTDDQVFKEFMVIGSAMILLGGLGCLGIGIGLIIIK